jgi:CRP-like cAMP-binding protein
MSDATADILATVPLLSGLDKKQRERMARDFKERDIPAGTVIIRQGDEHGMGFFILAEGEATVTVDGADVATLGPGSYFGEVALISDRVRTASVTAATDVRVLVMMLTDFRSFVRGDADVAWKLLEHVGMLLHNR